MADKKQKHVLVLGGGFTGIRVAMAMQDQYRITLVDSKDYFEFTPGILRTIVEPGHRKKVQVPYEKILKRGDFIRGKVQEVSATKAKVNGKDISFDYLVISMGSSYEAPFKEQDVVRSSRAKNLEKAHQRCEDAHTILVIGGGIVGVEMVGELCDRYRDKSIVLCHGNGELMPRSTKKARAYAMKCLKAKNVKMIFNEFISVQDGKVFTTAKGMCIKADVAFLCTGIKPNSQSLRSNFKDDLDNRGNIIVNDQLQVRNHQNIFAGGDITNILEEKLAQTAQRHADLIIKNIRNLDEGRPLAKYRSASRPMVISIGKRHGIFNWGRFTFTGIIPAILKSVVEFKAMLPYR